MGIDPVTYDLANMHVDHSATGLNKLLKTFTEEKKEGKYIFHNEEKWKILVWAENWNKSIMIAIPHFNFRLKMLDM